MHAATSPSSLLADLRQTPPAKERGDAPHEQFRIRAERAGGEDVDEQHPHAEQLCAASERSTAPSFLLLRGPSPGHRASVCSASLRATPARVYSGVPPPVTARPFAQQLRHSRATLPGLAPAPHASALPRGSPCLPRSPRVRLPRFRSRHSCAEFTPGCLARSRGVKYSAPRSPVQIRSKFFSISRRVSRSITGRPCGQTVEYAVARSSSRMCVIFS